MTAPAVLTPGPYTSRDRAMADYLLGLDAGNTVIKAALFDAADGRELAVVAQDGRASLPAPGHVERDLDELWANAVTVIAACIARAGIEPTHIRAIGCAGHGRSEERRVG